MVDTNGKGFGLKEVDAREEFPLSRGFWLARLGSKYKSWRKQTNIQVIKTNMQSSLEAQKILTREY